MAEPYPPVHCPDCGRTFTRWADLTKHRQFKHPGASSRPPLPPLEPIPPLQDLAWIETDLLPTYEVVCATYSPQRVGKWLREVYDDSTRTTLDAKVAAMTLTITSAALMAPWWQQATEELGPDAPQEKVWPRASYLQLTATLGPDKAALALASYGLPWVPPDAPRASGRPTEGSPAPAGIPPSFYDLRDPPGKGLASITPLDDPA